MITPHRLRTMYSGDLRFVVDMVNRNVSCRPQHCGKKPQSRGERDHRQPRWWHDVVVRMAQQDTRCYSSPFTTPWAVPGFPWFSRSLQTRLGLLEHHRLAHRIPAQAVSSLNKIKSLAHEIATTVVHRLANPTPADDHAEQNLCHISVAGSLLDSLQATLEESSQWEVLITVTRPGLYAVKQSSEPRFDNVKMIVTWIFCCLYSAGVKFCPLAFLFHLILIQ